MAVLRALVVSAGAVAPGATLVVEPPSVSPEGFRAPARTPVPIVLLVDGVVVYANEAAERSRNELDGTDGLHRRLDLEVELRRAIADRALGVAYQPLIRPGTGEVGCFEALVRWDHPAHGRIDPEEFVGVAEDSGMIGALGELVLAEALDAVRRWHAAGADVPVAVNVSGRQLDDTGLVEAVRAAIDHAQVDPAWLELEITETALQEHSQGAIATLHGLRALGVRLSIDDFGTGSSTLAALRTLPVDTVKLDRRFQQDVEDDPRACAVVTAVVQLAHALDLVAVAEGVASESHLDLLAGLGFDLVQGYHVAQAMPEEDVVAFVAARSRG